jgi:hypothetical protein
MRLMREDDEHVAVDGWSDAGWAGAPGFKSVSCGVVTVSGMPVTTYSRTQALVALSSAESELIALTTAVQETLFVARVLTELQLQPRVHIYSDSTAALGIIERRGVGRLRHLKLRLLWLQQVRRSQEAEFHHVGTAENVADIGTKGLSTVRHNVLREALGVRNLRAEEDELEQPSVMMLEAVSEASQLMESKNSWWAAVMFGFLVVFVTTWWFVGAQTRKETKEVACQTPVTYTEVRGSVAPRFQVLPQAAHGAFR